MQVLDYRIKQRDYKREYLSPKNKTFEIDINNQDIKRPLKQNLSDLSFKGLFFKPPKNISQKQYLDFYTKHIGKGAEKTLEDIANKTNNIITKDDKHTIQIREKTIFKLFTDGVLYPIRILPFDILRGTVSGIGKIPGLKNWSEKILEKEFFKNIEKRSKFDDTVNSLSGIISYKEQKIEDAIKKFAKANNKTEKEVTPEEKAKLIKEIEKDRDKKTFVQAMRAFNPSTGNYDLKHERSLNRIVSGFPPALFLGIDAYNLSRMMDDNEGEAKKEQKTRFKQETVRVLSNAWLTLITMGAFQKYINKSPFGITLNTGLTVLITEMFSRLSNGKHITRLTPEEAKMINQKESEETKNLNSIKNKDDKQNAKSKETKNSQVQPQKPLLSFDTLLKASGVVIAAGYGLRGIQKLPFLEKAAQKFFTQERLAKYNVKPENITEGKNAVKTFREKVLFGWFNDKYKKLVMEQERSVDKDDILKVAQSIEDAGFDKLSQTMKNAIEKNIGKNGRVSLNDKDKFIKPFIDFALAPFQFAGKAISLPYRLVKKVEDTLRAMLPKNANKIITKASNIDSEMKKALSQSYDKIVKYQQKLEKQYTDKAIVKEKLTEFIKSNIIKSFNTTTMSEVSNAELSNLAKTGASIATLWFLMTDNYNMVMLKSNGEDKEGAETKFKERFVQEVSRLFYQTLLIHLFNSTFRNQYNSSLLGMSWITFTDTFLGEMLTRSSVGTPIKPHTRDELIKIEDEQVNSTGFKKKYYNFMQRLTGKRPIITYDVKNNN